MIKAKQVFFWTSNLKCHGFHGDEAIILYLTSKYIHCAVWKILFSWNRSSTSKVMVILMYDAESAQDGQT